MLFTWVIGARFCKVCNAVGGRDLKFGVMVRQEVYNLVQNVIVIHYIRFG